MSYKIIFSFQSRLSRDNVPRGTFKILDKLKGSFVEKLLNNHRDTEKDKTELSHRQTQNLELATDLH